jgi:acyl carrier protein
MKEIAKIHNFVQSLLTRIGDDEPLTDDESLLISGRLQSIDAVGIIVFLEENFKIDFGQIGFDREQIDSIDAIYALTQAASKGD